MFSTLRSRLWFTYALLIATALALVALVLFIYLAVNPLTYRQASARIGVVQSALLRREADWLKPPGEALQDSLRRADETFDARILVFDPRGQLLSDSRAGATGALAMPRQPRLRSSGVVRDSAGESWLISVAHLADRSWLMVAIPVARVPVLAILRDEFFPPLLAAGSLALLLSLLFAFWVARWVADPLQRVVQASRAFPEGDPAALKEEGPEEVRALVRAFNAMVARVQSSQKAQREFVANVSHELKTPLTSIQGFAQALLDGTADSEVDRVRSVEIIQNEAGRMHRLVMDLLDLARLDSGTADLRRESVDLHALLGGVGQRFQPQARSGRVSLELALEQPLVVRGDADRLAQVFINLVDNALKFTPADGRVMLIAAAADSGVEVRVRDSGSGIPESALPYIFERFYRADPSRSGGAGRGAGLGLSIAYEIIRAHGGKIAVHSAPGQGAEFVVWLPLDPSSAETLARRRA